jgi:hypothetical protein
VVSRVSVRGPKRLKVPAIPLSKREPHNARNRKRGET